MMVYQREAFRYNPSTGIDYPMIKLKTLEKPVGDSLASLTLEVIKGPVAIEVYLTIDRDNADQLIKAIHICAATHAKLTKREEE